MTDKTVFRIYSTSKLMTAVAEFELIEQGKLALDTPLTNFFADLPKGWSDVTIGHLLAHASGLPDVRGLISEMADESLSDEQFLSLVYPLERQFPTGEGWSYTQTNYLLLKRIIERVTREEFETYLRSRAFSNIDAKRTIFSSNDLEVIPNRAKNYQYAVETASYEQKLQDWGSRNNVLAGLNLTLDDLIDWSQAFDADAFLSPTTRDAM